MNVVKPNEKTTLLLNNAWQPITVITARAGFQHLLKGRITAIDKNSNTFSSLESWYKLAEFYDDQPCMRSAHQSWAIPTIVITTQKFFRKPRKTKLSLFDLAKLCDFTCQYCFEKFHMRDLTIDHVKPKSKGGLDTHDNRVLSCGRCNRQKSNFTPWFDKNGKEPVPPMIPKIILDSTIIREEWKFFVEKHANTY